MQDYFVKKNDMESIPCDFCHNTKTTPCATETAYLKLFDPYQIVRCLHCGLLYMNPRMTEREYRDFYRSSKYYDDHQYDSILFGERLPKFVRRIQTLARYKPSRGTLLDIGTATGEFLNLAREDGWQVFGTEVSEFAARKAKELYNIDVFTGTLDQAPFSPHSFDIIHLSHVLEHVPSPRSTVRMAKRLLRPGGYLIIEVPFQFGNGFDFLARRIGRSHPYKDPSFHHVYFYSPKTLRRILRKEGLFPTIRTYSANVPYQAKHGVSRFFFRLLTPLVDWLGYGLYIEAFARADESNA